MEKLRLLKTKLEQLRRLYKTYDSFGARSHCYRFNKRLP